MANMNTPQPRPGPRTINPEWVNATYGIEMTHPQVTLNNSERYLQMVQEQLAHRPTVNDRGGLRAERELTATMRQTETDREHRARVESYYNNVPPYRDWLGEESRNEPQPRHPSEFPCA